MLGINLGKIAIDAIQCINKNEFVSVQIWQQQVIDDSGYGTSSYLTLNNISAQIQPVDTQKLMHKDYYNFNSVYKVFYFTHGEVINGLNRQIPTAGDYIFWRGLSYKIVEYPENYESNWIQVIGAQGINETTP